MRKKERKLSVISLGMIRKNKLGKMIRKERWINVYKLNVQLCSMTDPCILTTPAFRLIEEDFKDAIHKGPTYICDICWKFEFRRNVIKLKEPKYPADIYNKCTTGKSDGIWKSCHNSMSKNKMPL